MGMCINSTTLRGIKLSFEILFSRNAYRFMRRIKSNPVLYSRLMKKIRKLAEEPIPADAKRILGRDEKIYRIRVGDYRILYLVNFKDAEVFISKIDKRSRVYALLLLNPI